MPKLQTFSGCSQHPLTLPQKPGCEGMPTPISTPLAVWSLSYLWALMSILDMFWLQTWLLRRRVEAEYQETQAPCRHLPRSLLKIGSISHSPCNATTPLCIPSLTLYRWCRSRDQPIPSCCAGGNLCAPMGCWKQLSSG